MDRKQAGRSDSGPTRQQGQEAPDSSAVRRGQGPDGLRGASRDDDGRVRQQQGEVCGMGQVVHVARFGNVKAEVCRLETDLGVQLVVQFFRRRGGRWRPLDGASSQCTATNAAVGALSDEVLGWILAHSPALPLSPDTPSI